MRAPRQQVLRKVALSGHACILHTFYFSSSFTLLSLFHVITYMLALILLIHHFIILTYILRDIRYGDLVFDMFSCAEGPDCWVVALEARRYSFVSL